MSIAIEKAGAALKRANGNPDKARDLLRADAAGERALREELIDLGIGQAVSTALTGTRDLAIRAGAAALVRPDRLKTEGGIGMKAMEQGLYAFALPQTGKLLGDATRNEVADGKNAYAAQREGFERRERFLGLVLLAAKDPKLPIRKQIRAEDLGNMWTRAAKEAAA